MRREEMLNAHANHGATVSALHNLTCLASLVRPVRPMQKLHLIPFHFSLTRLLLPLEHLTSSAGGHGGRYSVKWAVPCRLVPVDASPWPQKNEAVLLWFFRFCLTKHDIIANRSKSLHFSRTARQDGVQLWRRCRGRYSRSRPRCGRFLLWCERCSCGPCGPGSRSSSTSGCRWLLLRRYGWCFRPDACSGTCAGRRWLLLWCRRRRTGTCRRCLEARGGNPGPGSGCCGRCILVRRGARPCPGCCRRW